MGLRGFDLEAIILLIKVSQFMQESEYCTSLCVVNSTKDGQ